MLCDIIVALNQLSYHNSIMKMKDLKQTYIIFTASDTVYCTAESYDLANEIIEADGLIDAIIQQVNHITSIEEGNPVTISYENTSTYDCLAWIKSTCCSIVLSRLTGTLSVSYTHLTLPTKRIV